MRTNNAAEDIAPALELGSDVVDVAEEIADSRYALAKIKAGLASADNEPTVSLQDARKRLGAVIRQVESSTR